MKKVIVDGIEITLTKTQEKQLIKSKIIKVDKTKKLTFKDLKDFETIEMVLKQLPTHIKCVEKDFKDKQDWFSYRMRTIIKGLNFVNNNYQDWIKDWNNPNEYYYTPYFRLDNNSFSYYDYYHSWTATSVVGFGWGFKSKELMEHCVKYFLNEYKQYHKGEY